MPRGPKGEKRPADVIGAAVKVMRIATGEIEEPVSAAKPPMPLRFARYNFVRVHKTLGMMPTMAAGVSDRLWTLEELVEQTSRWVEHAHTLTLDCAPISCCRV
jgi:hypothetical protein